MTKKELQETMLFLAEVRSTIVSLARYGKDYDSSTIRILAEDLEKAIIKYRKEAKI